jgi:TPR repeat protein
MNAAKTVNRMVLAMRLAIGALMLSACGASTALPKPPAAPEFDPKIVFRDLAKGSSRPMVVDWAPADRASLEVHVSRGAIVVRISESGIEPLWDCAVASGTKYEFTGVSPKRDHVDARSDAELAANFPMGFAKLRSMVHAGRAISADVRMIGVAELNRLSVKRTDLPAQCQTATHFVKELTIGGFQFGSVAAEGGGAGAGIGGIGADANYQGVSSRMTEEGDFKVCENADPDSRAAPPRCKGILRVRLVPIDQDATGAETTCGAGTRWNGRSCVQTEGTATVAPKAFVCKKGDARECLEQCKQGNAVSCRLAGEALVGTPQGTPDEFKSLFAAACKGEDWEGCSLLGEVLQAEGKEDAAAKLHSLACLHGVSDACVNYGVAVYFGRGGIPKDPALSLKLWERACRLGKFMACSNAGVILQHGEAGLRRDDANARRLFELSCKNGVALACTNAGFLMELGLGGSGDKNGAFKLYVGACEQKDALGCVFAGLWLERQSGNDRQRISRALAFYERACDMHDVGGGCGASQMNKELYGGRFTDAQIARFSCDGGTMSELGCFNAAVVHANSPGFQDEAKAASFAKRACMTAGAAKDFCAKMR